MMNAFLQFNGKEILHNVGKISANVAKELAYEEYANDEKWQQLVAKLPWGHNLLLIEKIKNKDIRKIYTENTIKNGWSRNVLLELGKGFSFVGNQYKISVDNQDYYIDLLFYHLELRCYVVVELKASEFKPEYIGQLGFYVTAVNETIKKECDSPSIALLLCRGKNRVTVDWSLKSTNVPIGGSTYKLKEQLPKELIDKLPTEEDINLYLNVGKGGNNE